MERDQRHDEELSFPRPVKLAKKNSLPSAKAELSILKWNGHTRADERRFDMCVGIMFEVSEVWFKLRYQAIEKAEHIGLHIGVGILIDRQAAGRVLRK